MQNQLKAGVVLNYVLIILNALVGLLYTPYMLRMMGQSEYGLYQLVASVISYLTVLDLGFGNAIVRYTAKYRAEGKVQEQYEMFGMFLILYIIIGLISLIAGGALYANVDNMFGNTMTVEELHKARVMMLILVANLAFTFPMSIFGSIITAYERFVFPKVVNIVRTILNTAVMIVLLSMGYKAIAMVVVTTIFNVFTLLLNYFYCRNKLHVKIIFGVFKWGLLKEIAIYSFWILLNVIMDKIYWSTGQFVLGAISGTVEVAVFAIAIQLQAVYMSFSLAISSVFLPKVTGMISLNSNNDEISDLFIRTGRIQNIVMVLILSGFTVFGKQFITLWAGEEYLESYKMTLFFFIALYPHLIQNLGNTILQARNQMKFRSILNVLIAALALVLEIFFAKKLGGIGCSIAISIAFFFGQGILMNIYYCINQNLNVIKFWKEVVKMDIMPIILTSIFLYLTRKIFFINSWFLFCASVSFFTVLYVILCYYCSLNKYEKSLVVKAFARLYKIE